KDVAAFGTPAFDALSPFTKRAVRILRCVEALGSMETEIDEVARHRDVRGPPRRVGDDQRDVPATQERERILAEPRCIARLDGMPPVPRRDHLEESLGARLIELHSRR